MGDRVMMIFVSAGLILTFLGGLSLLLWVAGITALLDGSPVWFGLLGIALGGIGLASTHYHISLCIRAYKRTKEPTDG